MKILFIHQNFPSQFKFLGPALASQGHEVVAFIMQKTKQSYWKGIKLVSYGVARKSTRGIHPWLVDFETKVIRGEACFHASIKLKKTGFNPDIIIAHPSWGESLFLKHVWPNARIGLYCEHYYRADGADIGFDPEIQRLTEADACKVDIKNIANLMSFETADALLSPTKWQAANFPSRIRERISVVHDGIDTNHLRPNSNISLTVSSKLTLTKSDEIVTFVNRNLEPYRGYHIFMRALPEILKRRPNAHVFIVGRDGKGYGALSESGRSWKDIFIDEVRSKISDSDWSRVHFMGQLPYNNFISLLQLSSVHVYWTYPFVLSWSLLEAMSIGCAIVASKTAPVEEVMVDDQTGRLVDFFDYSGLAREVCNLLDDPKKRLRLGLSAREFVKDNYDLQSVCLPMQLQWFANLASGVQTKSAS